MSRFTYLHPGSTKKRCKALPPDPSALNPILTSYSISTLLHGTIVHSVENDRGINAYGILDGNRLEVNVRPRSQYQGEFEEKLVNDIKSCTGPILLFQHPLPPRLEEIIEKLTPPLVINRISSLSLDSLLDVIASYPIGLANLLEKKNSSPDSPVSARELGTLVRHALLCKLAIHVVKNLQTRLSTSDSTSPLKGIDRYLALECTLPISFDGTVINLQTTGLQPGGSHILTAGFLRGSIIRIFLNSDCLNDFHELVIKQMNNSPSPHAAYNKIFVEKFLTMDIEIELMQVKTSRQARFRNLLAGFSLGYGETAVERARQYFGIKSSRVTREQVKKDIVFYSLTCLVLESLLPVIDSNCRWKVTNSGDLELFVNKNYSSKAIEKYKKRDNSRNRKRRKGLIDYTIRKPRGRVIKASKFNKNVHKGSE
ncbi:MAG: hypothetical protein ACXADA_10275 [Candidatus Hodarchaeales archaeon]|jgi:hypothetical protein